MTVDEIMADTGWTWAAALEEARAEALAFRSTTPASPRAPSAPGRLHYRLSISCPLCGGPLEHVASSAPHPHVNIDARAVAQCPPCNHTFLIEIKLTSNRHHARRMKAHEQAVDVYAAQALAESSRS